MIFALYDDGKEEYINGEVWHEPEDGMFGFELDGYDVNEYPNNLILIYDKENQVGVHFFDKWQELFYWQRGFEYHLTIAKDSAPGAILRA